MSKSDSSKKTTQPASQVYDEELRSKLALASGDLGLWDWNFKEQEIFYSANYCEMLGYSIEEVPTKIDFWHERLHPDDYERALATLDAHAAGQTTIYINEFRMRMKNGEYRWIRSRGRMVERDENGEAVRMLGTHMDINAEHEMTEALRASEERQRQLAIELEAERARLTTAQQVAKVGSWEIDTLNQKVRWSAETFRIFELSQETYKPSIDSLFDYIHPEDLDKFKEQFESSKNEKSSPTVDVRLLLKDGQLKYIEQRWINYHNAEGQLVRTLGTCLDITKRKLLEQQFLRSQRMENIGNLAGGIAHDLNNALAPILLTADLLKYEITNPEHLKRVKTIETSALHGAGMIKHLLAFARGAPGLQLPVDICNLLEAIVRLAEETFLKSIRIDVKYLDKPYTVIGDPTQLQQVFVNLCVNARDAMPKGGLLKISAEIIELNAQQLPAEYSKLSPGQFCRVDIEDNGMGIAKEDLGRIYDPFYTTKRVGEGTGLGLSTSLNIVKGHHGFMNFESVLGEGSKFTVFLPVSAAEKELFEMSAVEKPVAGNGYHILVVDDEDLMRSSVKQTLESFGYRVTAVESGLEALRVLRRPNNNFSLMLTDMIMPVMDGVELIVKASKLYPDLPIIASGGLYTQEAIDSALENGAVHFIPKPYEGELLANTLRQYIK